MTPRQKLSAIFSVPCHEWCEAPAAARDCLQLIAKFGMQARYAQWAEQYVYHAAGRCLWDVQFLISNYIFRSCLNVGGAPFVFEHLIKRSLPDVKLVSVDLNRARFPLVQKVLEIDVIDDNIENPSPSKFSGISDVECVVFCEIFEHLRINLLGTISFLKTLLADNGLLYLTTPNGIGISALRRLMSGRTGPDPVSEWLNLQEVGHMGHVREYSFFEVRDVLEHCGFYVDKLVYRNRPCRQSHRMLSRIAPIIADEIVLVARKRV